MRNPGYMVRWERADGTSATGIAYHAKQTEELKKQGKLAVYSEGGNVVVKADAVRIIGYVN
jgi:diaminopimelate epimerase